MNDNNKINNNKINNKINNNKINNNNINICVRGDFVNDFITCDINKIINKDNKRTFKKCYRGDMIDFTDNINRYLDSIKERRI